MLFPHPSTRPARHVTSHKETGKVAEAQKQWRNRGTPRGPAGRGETRESPIFLGGFHVAPGRKSFTRLTQPASGELIPRRERHADLAPSRGSNVCTWPVIVSGGSHEATAPQSRKLAALRTTIHRHHRIRSPIGADDHPLNPEASSATLRGSNPRYHNRSTRFAAPSRTITPPPPGSCRGEQARLSIA